jgi:eukaryotic-like serine/threonine-protein kinase
MTSSPEADLAGLLAQTGYRALARIGRGGMGEVFEVEHELLGRRFAAKVLRAELAQEPSFVERMRVEAQSMARLRHPHIVEVTDFCVTLDGRPCLIMERLRGRTVGRELAERGRLPLPECVKLVEQVLSALAAAHHFGVVHRDLKPENLFLHEAPSSPRRLKVLDFGLARILPQASPLAPLPTAIPTSTGQLVGSPRFVSPEAIIGKQVDHRADLYSLGLILYILLTGHGPFDHMTIAETLSHEPDPPSRFRDEPGVRALDGLVLAALKKRPEDRWQSATDFSSALAALVHHQATLRS